MHKYALEPLVENYRLLKECNKEKTKQHNQQRRSKLQTKWNMVRNTKRNNADNVHTIKREKVKKI